MPGKPLIDLSDKELRAQIRTESARVTISYKALIGELDRRAQSRQARGSFILSVVSMAIAVVAVIVAASRG
jgi:hypothetical protein